MSCRTECQLRCVTSLSGFPRSRSPSLSLCLTRQSHKGTTCCFPDPRGPSTPLSLPSPCSHCLGGPFPTRSGRAPGRSLRLPHCLASAPCQQSPAASTSDTGVLPAFTCPRTCEPRGGGGPTLLTPTPARLDKVGRCVCKCLRSLQSENRGTSILSDTY